MQDVLQRHARVTRTQLDGANKPNVGLQVRWAHVVGS